jgi:hypothetical protein
VSRAPQPFTQRGMTSILKAFQAARLDLKRVVIDPKTGRLDASFVNGAEAPPPADDEPNAIDAILDKRKSANETQQKPALRKAVHRPRG